MKCDAATAAVQIPNTPPSSMIIDCTEVIAATMPAAEAPQSMPISPPVRSNDSAWALSPGGTTFAMWEDGADCMIVEPTDSGTSAVASSMKDMEWGMNIDAPTIIKAPAQDTPILSNLSDTYAIGCARRNEVIDIIAKDAEICDTSKFNCGWSISIGSIVIWIPPRHPQKKVFNKTKFLTSLNLNS